MSFQQLHEVELKFIFTTLDIYDQVVLQRVCKHWKKIIRRHLLPKYLKQNYPHIYKKYDSYKEHSRMLLDMLPHEQIELNWVDQLEVDFQFLKRNHTFIIKATYFLKRKMIIWMILHFVRFL